MYEVSDSSVTKRLETWKIIIPLHDNDGKYFDSLLIESITKGIVDNYPGLTSISCVGHWKEGVQTFKDQNLELIVDTAPILPTASEAFFVKYKSDLQKTLNQSKIYVTRESSKQEILTFDEFFQEVGLQCQQDADLSAKKKLATESARNVDVLMRRMGYETTTLRRVPDHKTILWERKVAGILLRSEIDDSYPDDSVLVAADRIDHFVNALARRDNVVVIGDWEYQTFALSNLPFIPLVPSKLPMSSKWAIQQYMNQKGEPISHKRFVEEFTMLIICGVMALRDEGYQVDEIKISIGSDGSLQWTEGTPVNVMFHNPAMIPDKAIQNELLRCVKQSAEEFQNGECPVAAVQQAKALHQYVFKRAAIRLARQQTKLNS